ncbi:MAG TPA: FAD-binding oxidoreductase [Vicinamibacterales bacterium]
MAIFTCRISGVIIETPRNRIVRLALDGRAPAFEAGQYALLGDHGQPVRKPYSIASSPAQAADDGELEFLIQVSRDESPGTHLAELTAGRLVDVDGPFGSFVLPAGVRPRAIALIGGGTGIAPLRAMLWQILSESPATRIAVLQSARTPDELPYSGELRSLASEGRIALVETVTREAPPSWHGHRGRVDARTLGLLVDRPDTWCFVCGPDSLVEAVPRLLAGVGVNAANIRTEHWADEQAADHGSA